MDSLTPVYIHCNGSYEIVDKLRFSINKNIDDSISISVFFLTPCHVTPFQGYLHRENVKFDFIKCHPRIVDELMPIEDSSSRDQFSNDPLKFIKENVIEKHFTHLILFEKDLQKYLNILNENYYKECGRAGNSSILPIGSKKLRGDLLIYCKSFHFAEDSMLI